MAIFLFSILVLFGLIPAIFLLDKLFGINFAKAARVRPESKDSFWQPRGFAGTGNEDRVGESRRPIGKGLKWIVSAPDSIRTDRLGAPMLRAYRFSVVLMLIGVIGLLLSLFVI